MQPIPILDSIDLAGADDATAVLIAVAVIAAMLWGAVLWITIRDRGEW
jgi:hypothetical protein